MRELLELQAYSGKTNIPEPDSRVTRIERDVPESCAPDGGEEAAARREPKPKKAASLGEAPLILGRDSP